MDAPRESLCVMTSGCLGAFVADPCGELHGPGGAEAYLTLASLLVTGRQRTVSAVDGLIKRQQAAGGATPRWSPRPSVTRHYQVSWVSTVWVANPE